MSAIVPNWTKILGKVVAVEAVEGSAMLLLVRVVLMKKEAQYGFPDLMVAKVGDSVGVRGSRAVVETLGIGVGCEIAASVRAGGGVLFYFDPESITINKA
jgi:hypothetical protein